MRNCWRFLLLGSLLSGCAISSKTALDGSGGRTAYNVVLQMTNSEQMLLNLVRLRYYDAPFFLDVATITTQFTYTASASPTVPIPGFNNTNPFTLGGGFTWSNQPTIQYTPLEGQAFANQLLTPIDLGTIQQLVLAGWDIELIFRLLVQGVDDLLNMPEASGPIPEFICRYRNFFEMTRLLRFFQVRSQLKLGVKRVCEEQKEDNGKESRETLQIAFPKEGKEADRLAKLFSDVREVNEHYVAKVRLGFSHKGRIGIIPRSILSAMHYLSLGIQVPEGDLKLEKLSESRNEAGDVFDWKEVMQELIVVECSGFEPKNAYISVKYKNLWFYIDERDYVSKKTFLLLLQLYNLKAQEPKTLPPLLTLPLG